jgi:hypothetical protein
MNLVVLVASIVAVLVVARRAGAWRWQQATDALVERLRAARTGPAPGLVDLERELASLPAPVQRYFRTALTSDQLLVAAARLEHEGLFNMSETAEQWRPFGSHQWIVTSRPGFVWDGRVALARGVAVRVHDAYIAGQGTLHAALFGLLSVADLRGTADVDRGELMRYIAEAPLVPTALLPSQGVRWTQVDDTSADATLDDGALSLTLRFCFNEQGLVDTVTARGRGRKLGGRVVETPWQGRWWRYERRDGMLIPTEGEVAWLLPEGPRPYWRGRLRRIDYEFAPRRPDPA